MENLVSIDDLPRHRIEKMLDKAEEMENGSPELMKGKVMSLLFFEPSTRTRLSFETAMKKLGGSVIDLKADKSSLNKGETVRDTAKVLAEYGDIAVVRSPREGAARFLAEEIDIPVINAGDGANQHPTQTLLDLYTIRKELGEIDGLKIGLMGDLKYGRTVHSLIHALEDYDVSIRLISPEQTRLPDHLKEEIDDVEETREIEISDLDVVYATRIQKERFPEKEEYRKVKGSYVLDEEKVGRMKEDAILMHPLPRINEIKPEVDEMKQSKYFEQAGNGVPVRMAIIKKLMEAVK